ncbi:MAG: hypothetical protein J6L64_00215 [Opitutales bacterium]|nr:hypothetical protein [Opitutales bacterium]
MITKITLLAGLVAGIICGKGFFHSELKALKKSEKNGRQKTQRSKNLKPSKT